MREVKEYEDRIVFTNYEVKNNKKKMISRQTVLKNQPVPLYAPNCKMQTCGVCSKPGSPVFLSNHKDKTHEFQSSGDGCYHTFIGKKPVRVRDECLTCDCHED